MASVDKKNRKIGVKIVYYGPGRGGKSTNLEYIYNTYRDRIRSRLSIVNWEEKKTFFFDYFLFNLGTINDYRMDVKFFSVPGQSAYQRTRRLILKKVDGIVFVADSILVRREKNIISLMDLRENLSILQRDIFRIPIVFQYNKRDLEKKGIPLLDIASLEADLNHELRAPYFEASALYGRNVIPTMKEIIELVVRSLRKGGII